MFPPDAIEVGPEGQVEGGGGGYRDSINLQYILSLSFVPNELKEGGREENIVRV